VTEGDLLTTTEAAKILRRSRQYVANLCDRGELPTVRTGVHRRIPRRDVEALVGPPARREDERSLWINYALAAKLIADPTGVIEKAKRRLEELRAAHSHGRSNVYLDRWERALNEGPVAVLTIMTSRTDDAATMRSASPISGLGLLTDEERTRVLGSFRSFWRASHESRAA
jgi:excisionase family DNA binding protein